MEKPLIKRIVVAINGTEQSLHGAMYAILMAKQYGCVLKAVYVVDTATIKQLTLSKFFVSDESASYENSLESDGNKILSDIVVLAAKKGVKIQTELRKGSVWAQIIMSAEDFNADLIILGGKEHGASSFQSVVNRDSVSATNIGIVGNASCNVLIVREKNIEKLFKTL